MSGFRSLHLEALMIYNHDSHLDLHPCNSACQHSSTGSSAGKPSSLHPTQSPHSPPIAPLDVIKVGNYDIYNCGPLARNITVQMLALQSVLRPALADTKNFSFPSPAYTTFFKEPLYAPFVASILSQTTRGASVLPGNVLPNDNIPPSPPMLACAIDPAKIPISTKGTIDTIGAY